MRKAPIRFFSAQEPGQRHPVWRRIVRLSGIKIYWRRPPRKLQSLRATPAFTGQ